MDYWLSPCFAGLITSTRECLQEGHDPLIHTSLTPPPTTGVLWSELCLSRNWSERNRKLEKKTKKVNKIFQKNRSLTPWAANFFWPIFSQIWRILEPSIPKKGKNCGPGAFYKNAGMIICRVMGGGGQGRGGKKLPGWTADSALTTP